MIAITDQRRGRALLLAALDPDMTMQPLVPDASVGPLQAPLGLCILAEQYVVIADHGGGRLVVFDGSSNAWSTFGSGGTFATPRAVAPNGAGGLLVADTRRVVLVEDQTGSNLVDVLPALDGRVPLAVAARQGTEIDVALADGSLHRSADGGTSWRTVSLPGPKPARPVAVARGETGPTYVCDMANARVLAVDDDDAISAVLDATHGVVLPTAVAVAGQSLFVVDTGANRVRRFALGAGHVEPAEYVNGRSAEGGLRFDQVGGIAAGAF